MTSVRTVASLLLLSGILSSCTTPSPSGQRLSTQQPSVASSPSATDGQAGCARLRASATPSSLSFSALREGLLGETWDFDIYAQDDNDSAGNAVQFAWLCGNFWIPTSNAEPAHGTLDILISPQAYQALQSAFAEADFFTLPVSLNPTVVSMPRYIIEAPLGTVPAAENTRNRRTHRVTLEQPATVPENSPELARFQTLWDAFNTLLPPRLQIGLLAE